MTTYVAEVTYIDGTNEIVRGYNTCLDWEGCFHFVWYGEKEESFVVPFTSVKHVSSHKEE